MENIDKNTEQKIKEAAKMLFYQKGYAGTRTREIAEQAEVNLALLNYYFRSKEKLFNEIMLDSIREILGSLLHVIDDKKLSMMEKVNIIVSNYIDTFTVNPQLPLFVLSEIRNDAKMLLRKVGIPDYNILQTHFFRQLQQQIDTKHLGFSPIQIFLNIISLSIMPTATQNLIQNAANLTDTQFNAMIQDRKQLIPQWIKTILQIEN